MHVKNKKKEENLSSKRLVVVWTPFLFVALCYPSILSVVTKNKVVKMLVDVACGGQRGERVKGSVCWQKKWVQRA